MFAATPSRDVPALRMVEAMTACAFELGTAAGEIAKTAGDDFDRFLSFSTEFRHCFFAVRMGLRLTLFGVPAPRAASTANITASERDRPDGPEAPERDPAPRRDDAERERDRDCEPVSLPQFLKTLGIVARTADKVRDQFPAHVRDTTLPTLQALLAEATPPPDPKRPVRALAVLARPSTTTPPARSHLLNSARPAPAIRGRPPPRPSG